jgi:hypothetical protein
LRYIAEHFETLVFANTLIICPDKIKFSGRGMWEWCKKYEIDFMSQTPSTFSMWGTPPKLQQHPKIMVSGGEKIPLLLLRTLEQVGVVLNG